MNVHFEESLTINGETIALHGELIDMTGHQDIVDNFSEMILGVANAAQLTQQQKDYIIEMLEDQLNTEVQTAIMLAEYNDGSK